MGRGIGRGAGDLAACAATGAVTFGLACAAIAGCTASAEDVRAPQDQLFFPTGVAVTPDEKTLFVANGNSELRFDSGSLSVVDVATVENVLGPWLTCQGNRSACVVQPDCSSFQPTPGHTTCFELAACVGFNPTTDKPCCHDTDQIETMICDEGKFIRTDAGVRIGNFATEISIQDFSFGSSSPLRVFVPTRGDPSISWADFDGHGLRCTVGGEPYAQCDDAHRLTTVLNNADIGTIPSEPFAVFADVVNDVDAMGKPLPPSDGFALVTHLSAGAVTLIRAPEDSSKVQIVDLAVNVFQPSLITGIRGASSVAGRLPGSAGDMLYVGSSTDNRVQTFTVGRRDNVSSYLLPGAYFFLTAVGITGNAGASTDTRGMRFSPTGNRMYVANRAPPSLQIWDTSLDRTGAPRNTATGSSDICREASGVTVLDPGDGERAYVTCFQDGQVYVVDPRGQSEVEDIVTVGRGPYGVAGITGKNAPGRKQLFVSNFLEDTIAVIDVAPGSPTRNRVVLRIGIPRAP
jgi:YVTN family beta-propeller protein